MPSPSIISAVHASATPQSNGPDPSNSATIQDRYFGLHSDGRIRVNVNGRKALITGTLYVIGEKRRVDGSLQKTRRRTHTTSGYETGSADEISFLAIGCKTKKLYRIIGCPEYCVTRPVSALAEPTSPDSVTAAVAATVTANGPADSHRHQQRAERRERALRREHAAVTVQLSLGLDPLISIAFLSHISGRSVTTLYREFGKALPRPIKQGSRSRMLYSAAQAYMAARPIAASK